MAMTESDHNRHRREGTTSALLHSAPQSVLRRRMTAVIAAFVAATALAAVMTGPVLAAPGDLTIDQAEQEKQRLRQHQVELASQIDAAKATNEDLIAALTTLDQQVQAQTARAAEAEAAANDAQRRYDELKGQLDKNQTEVNEINNDLRTQAVRRYLKPENDDSSVRLLKANDFDEAQQKKVLGDAVAGNSRDLIERLRGAKGRLDALAQQASETKAEADTRKAEQNDLAAKVIEEQKVKQGLQAEWDKRLKDLKAGEDHLDEQIAGLDQAIAAQQRPAPGPVAAPAPQSSNGRFIKPVAGRLGDPYGGARNHPGVDLLAPVGTPVWAAGGGTVVTAVSGGGYNGGYGNVIYIDHGDGKQTRYAHLSTVRVSVGQRVQQGAVIGNVGMTGNTSGPHLHFEVWVNGTKANPANYLPPL
jgi:murein DD-endopeptidase MepM/ murein hydrolase activator NlpD